MTIGQEILIVEGEKVFVNPENLKFNETTLTEYIKVEGGYYDNFGGYLARAEKVLQMAEQEAEELYQERFAFHKNKGGSDKLAEAQAESDDVVKTAKRSVIEVKYVVNRLKNHLKAWDKNHENAQSLGHMLRKEMDKLSFTIKDNAYDAVGNYVKSM